MTKNILITGGAGFIGSNLVKRLLDTTDFHIFVLDNLFTGSLANLDLDNPRLSLLQNDLTKPLEMELPPIFRIFHLACPASPPKYQIDPIWTLDTCYLGTKNVLELALKHNSQVLFSSTSEVYGDPQVPIQNESYRGNVNPIGPRSCYDEGKRVAETLCVEYSKKHKLDVKIFRIFNTYGPLMDPEDGRVVTNFINQALQNQPITIYGDGSQTRSFQYIDDLLDGILKLAEASNFYGPVNLGNPDEFTILELASQVLAQIPSSTSELVFKDLPVDDPMRRKPDISLAKEKLNWQPTIKLEQGLAKTIEYFKSL